MRQIVALKKSVSAENNRPAPSNDASKAMVSNKLLLRTKKNRSKVLGKMSARFRRIAKWSQSDGSSFNSIIHGDNAEVMDVLYEVMPESIKCAYIDPPYNNGEVYRHYHDTLGHEKWLSSVVTRVAKIHRLLKKDGVLWISIDENELHYLKVAVDEIFGRRNFIATVVWEHRTTRENRREFSNNHEYLLVYAKTKSLFRKSMNTLPITDSVISRYKNPDNDPRGPWQSVSANVQDGHATKSQFYDLVSPGGVLHKLPKGRGWCYTKDRMDQEIKDNKIWFGKDGRSAPRLKKFLSERKQGLSPETLWKASEVGTTSEAKKHLLKLFPGEPLFDTPKPEPLIYRILLLSTKPGDIVLDAYLGSGTTAAVSHKMDRRYIGIEVGEHIKTHCSRRIKMVINGENEGLSDIVPWKGGGDFDFYVLKK